MAFIIGAALAMDAFAVSVSCGSEDKSDKYSYKYAFVTAFFFGLFQMLMPIIGWSVGKVGSSVIDGFDEWISFGILTFLGAKMILDSRNPDKIGSQSSFGIKLLLIMAAATSIDALTAGIVLPSAVNAYSMTEMIISAAIIGIVTFVLSFLGYLIGKFLNRVNPSLAEIIGGAVLIILGIKSVIFK